MEQSPESFAKETLPISLEEEMSRSYLDYAMSVIIGRALPDVRDGLKPVHRRVLYAMHELNNDWNRPHKKSARIVGEVIGKYHPHGELAIYDALVRMAQSFSLRYRLIDGHGNFGSVDGDSPAAMRYTEVRIAKVGHELLSDIDKETVDFVPNYDNAEQEPNILPARIPNLLINGSSGIAVGMATNVPPHNLGEVIDACLHLLEHPGADIEELIKIVPAPDFPTAAIIYGISGAREAYRTGRGRVVMRAKTHFEPMDKGQRTAIIVDEIPYQVNKRLLLERMAELVNEKKLEGISDIRDESDKSGMRVVIELKRGENADVILNNLYKFTQLQDTFSMNLLALVDGQPRLLNLKEIIGYFLSHRREIITRRVVFALRQAQARAHILEALAVALANIDEFIAIIKASPTPPEARKALTQQLWEAGLVKTLLLRIDKQHDYQSYRPESIDKTLGLQVNGLYQLSETQAQEILQMRLQRLTGLEQEKIIFEYQELIAKISDLLDTLKRSIRVTQIISDELKQIRQEFGDVRRSVIEYNTTELETEDLIPPQDRVVTLSHSGYIKSQPLSEYRAQKRGGRGKQATTIKEDDWIDTLFIANTHDTILCFSNRGRVYWLRVYEVPQGSRTSRGRPIINMFPLLPSEKVTVVLPIKAFTEDHFIFMATRSGTVKKTPLTAFSRPNKKGIIAINLDEHDVLIGAKITDGKHDILLFSDTGKVVRFAESEVRSTSRSTHGVRGIQLKPKQQVISLIVADAEDQTQSVLTATQYGYGKRTAISEYTRHGRGTQGIISIQTSKRNGKVVAATLVDTDDEIMLITTAGVLIRTRISEVREMGRTTQGVTLISLTEGTEQLSGLQRIIETESDDQDDDTEEL